MTATTIERWISLDRALCEACGVFAVRIFFRAGDGPALGRWCQTCYDNLEYSGCME